ncbi:hypothetical protein LRHMDP2_2854 [Lacticaseibacillus rhamnosus LRHMDP2]|uniref:Uncharacterized protein n=1 Tax=Lacticaseibacillus rhamnosus LRHMDP3 TaxID=1203259 RepID=A0AB33XQI8_LACRH|nr:hypothetical protein LRHMDP3_2903 [Lacticaseibacillus rhamnosus LRHMDP3]EKS48450.1 hypothetical protein LRHMDP2_2854 [Lacticaseibacillus rhamnosus LRHMDP2]
MVAMTKTGSSRPRPLMLRFLTGLAHAHHNAFTGAEVCV